MSVDDVSLCFKENAIYVSIMIKFLSDFSPVLIYQTSLASFCQRKKSQDKQFFFTSSSDTKSRRNLLSQILLANIPDVSLWLLWALH